MQQQHPTRVERGGLWWSRAAAVLRSTCSIAYRIIHMSLLRTLYLQACCCWTAFIAILVVFVNDISYTAMKENVHRYSLVSTVPPRPLLLANQASPDMMSADQKTISRGITVLSNSQSYVKSFDGMAYELKGKVKDGGSTADIKTVSG